MYESLLSKLNDDAPVECRDYHHSKLNSTCTFMKTTDDCKIDDGFVNYLVFAFCNFGTHQTWLAVVLLFFWLFVLFIGLGVTADSFFCPSLRVIADKLRLSQNVAGVTFLAFGNGAPDVFSAIAAITNAKDGDAGLAFGALLGAGIFVSTVVAGSICVIKPFQSNERPLLRDLIFFMLASFWTFKVIWDGYISIWETVGFLIVYLIYICVVIFGRLINQRIKRKRGIAHRNEFSSSVTTTTTTRSLVTNVNVDENINQDDYTDEIQRPLVSQEYENGVDEVTEREPLISGQRANHVIVQYPLSMVIRKALRTFSKSEWQEANIIIKTYLVINAPVLFILKLTIPLVDYEAENHNWNKFLNIINCLTGPIFAVFATKIAFIKLFNVLPIWAVALAFSLILAAFIMITTKWDERPKYHWLFALLGFLVSVIWIYTIANEIVNLLTAFGVILNISNTILGLTFLAWGNSLSDMVADIVSAKQGYPNMGMSACFGGPLFNILLGVGIPFTYGCIKSGGKGFTIKTSLLQDVLALFLGISLISTLVFIPCNKFKFTRRYGIYLLFLYAVALTACILVEANVIRYKS